MNDEPILRGFTPPVVPGGLREKTLAAARTALAASPRPDVWARLAASRAARLAWAASVAALAAANVLLPRNASPARTASVSPDEPGRPDAELAAITRLPRIDEHSLPALEGGRS